MSVEEKLLRGNIRDGVGVGGFWLNRLNRILAEGKPG